MGKLKKVGIAFGVVIVILVFLGYAASEGNKIQEKEKQEMMNLSDEMLNSMSVKWNYPDLLRNIDDYEDKIIHINGKVTSSQPDSDLIGVETGCSNVLQITDCDVIFIQTEQRFLVNDEITGFVSVDGLRTLQITKFTGAKVTEAVPNTEGVKLQCSNC